MVMTTVINRASIEPCYRRRLVPSEVPAIRDRLAVSGSIHEHRRGSSEEGEKMAGVAAMRKLVDPEQWRRLRHAFSRDVSAYVQPVETDPELTALLGAPFDSIEDVRDRLEQAERRLLAAQDRRAVFLTVYTEMTRATIRELRWDGFDDPAWVSRYLVVFAEYYRRALLHDERGKSALVPDPWIVAFGAARRGETLVLQDAFLGINAHINFDLALTLTDVGLDPQRSRKYDDHTRINRILRRLVDVQRELLAERYAPGLDRVGAALGEFDTIAAASGFRAAREKAWRMAELRTDIGWPPVERATRWFLDRTATGTAHLLVRPSADPTLMEALRAIEADELDLRRFAHEYHKTVRAGK